MKTKIIMPNFTRTNLRISTMVITANWGATLLFDKLFPQIEKIVIPIWYPDNGILKFENKNMVVGGCYKDIFTNRKITKKSFFNQSTLVLRRKVNETKNVTEGFDAHDSFKNGWKEVNVKLFANGGIQMTGVTSEEFAKETLDWLLNTFASLPDFPFDKPPCISKFSVQLINTDYSLNKYINQEALHQLFINEYNLFSMLEKTIYQGVNAKFFYNKDDIHKGTCTCSKFCKGQGSGDGDGECKRITMSIFRTGKIIITGARKFDQIDAAYKFLNSVFEKYENQVLYENVKPLPLR